VLDALPVVVVVVVVVVAKQLQLQLQLAGHKNEFELNRINICGANLIRISLKCFSHFAYFCFAICIQNFAFLFL